MSPAAKTPLILVSKVSKSVLIVPHFVTCNSCASNNCGRFSGSKPNAFMTKSAFTSNSDPFFISGFLLPESSGSPN